MSQTNPTGAEYTVTVRATSDQLRGDLAQAKSIVKQGMQEIAATSNLAITNSADLGAERAAKAREGGVTDRMEKLRKQSERNAEKDAIEREARQRLHMQPSFSDRRAASSAQRQRQESARDTLAFRQFITDRNLARNRDTDSFKQFISERNRANAERQMGGIMMGREPSMGDIEGAAGMEAKAGAKISRADALAAMARNAKIGLGVAAGAATFFREVDQSKLLSNRAFRDASERYAFRDRNAFNDPTIHAAADTMRMATSGETNPIGRVLSVLPRFSDELERASHSAGILAESHRNATLSIQQSQITSANLRGMPMESLRLQQEQELADKQGDWNKAIRNAKDIQFSGPTMWERLTASDAHGYRAGAANRAAKKAGEAVDRLRGTQELETDLASRQELARRQGIMVGAQVADYSGAESQSNLRNDTLGAFAARYGGSRQALMQKWQEKLAGVTRKDEREVLERQRDREMSNLRMESKLQLRSMASDNLGVVMSTGEGGRFAESNQMQFKMENANLDTMLVDVLNRLTAAIEKTPLLGSN